MSSDTDQLQTVLSAGGFSLTLPRATIFRVLQTSGPVTMAELIRLCATNLERSSVYRTIELYERLGIVQRLQVGWKYRLELSDQFLPHHHHMFCVRCGMTVELLEDAAMERRLHQLAKQYDFVAQEHQIEIKGLCSGCRGVAATRDTVSSS